MEHTLVLIKPDAMERFLVGEILARIERKGLSIVGLKMFRMTDELLTEHYSHLATLSFFDELKEFMRSAPLIAVCVEGVDAVQTMRRLAGITLSREADPGTIRGDFAMSVQCNLIHTSDSKETAAVEVPRFFASAEIFEGARILAGSIYAKKEML